MTEFLWLVGQLVWSWRNRSNHRSLGGARRAGSGTVWMADGLHWGCSHSGAATCCLTDHRCQGKVKFFCLALRDLDTAECRWYVPVQWKKHMLKRFNLLYNTTFHWVYHKKTISFNQVSIQLCTSRVSFNSHVAYYAGNVCKHRLDLVFVLVLKLLI